MPEPGEIKLGGEMIEEEKYKTDSEETNSGYNLELMKDMEPFMFSLVEQLKDKIESGEYGALLSDEVGGRIPTLVLRKIMSEKGPSKSVKTYFLSAGYYMPDKKNKENYRRLLEHLKNLDFGGKKILFISEVVFSGNTFIKIGKALRDAGIKNDFDAAALAEIGSIYDEMENNGEYFEGEVFMGTSPDDSAANLEALSALSGVRKAKKYSPIPEKSLENYKNAIEARKDARLMAKRVIEQVWKN